MGQLTTASPLLWPFLWRGVGAVQFPFAPKEHDKLHMDLSPGPLAHIVTAPFGETPTH